MHIEAYELILEYKNVPISYITDSITISKIFWNNKKKWQPQKKLLPKGVKYVGIYMWPITCHGQPNLSRTD